MFFLQTAWQTSDSLREKCSVLAKIVLLQKRMIGGSNSSGINIFFFRMLCCSTWVTIGAFSFLRVEWKVKNTPSVKVISEVHFLNTRSSHTQLFGPSLQRNSPLKRQQSSPWPSLRLLAGLLCSLTAQCRSASQRSAGGHGVCQANRWPAAVGNTLGNAAGGLTPVADGPLLPPDCSSYRLLLAHTINTVHHFYSVCLCVCVAGFRLSALTG